MNRSSSELKRFSHSVGQNWYHIVLVPKSRFPVFQWKETKLIAEEAFEWVCKRHNLDLFTKEIMPDHVHLFVSAKPIISPYKIVKSYKGSSSNFLRKKYHQLLKLPALWSSSYYCCSVGQVSESVIKNYIEKYIPHIGESLKELLSLKESDEKKVVKILTEELEKSRKM